MICPHGLKLYFNTVYLKSNTANIFNELPEADRVTTRNFNEKDFWSAQCMQCRSRFTTKDFNDLRQFVTFKRTLTFPVYSSVMLSSYTVGSKSKAVELEDVKFHQCVRLSRFENDRTISFIPPDGEFELMSYRLNTEV